MIKKIVVIGPESTGKSTLCEKLAQYYNTLWVPEYAREYLENNGSDYTYDDLLTIAKGQIESEDRIGYQLSVISNQQSVIINEQSGNSPNPDEVLPSFPPSEDMRLLFIDTDMYVMKVWAEYVFNRCHNWILNQIAGRKYDLYMLCDIDLPWIEDTLREYPDKKIREKLFLFYKELMINQSTSWCIISGDYEERLKKAIQFVDSSFT